MKIDRLIAIIMILLERDKVNAEELAKMFEVSVRTIYRDLDSINQSGIPVTAIPGPGNGISILNTYKLDKHLFSTSEITAMLSALDSIKSNLPAKELNTAFAKVKGMIPCGLQKELAFKANQIKIDFSPWIYSDSMKKRMHLIQQAMDKQYHLSFEYRDNKNQSTVREVEPYHMLLKGEDWYLRGFCLSRQEFRTFKILRMKNMNTIERIFEIRDLPLTPTDHVQFTGEALVSVRLRIHEDICDKIISRFGEECLSSDGPDHFTAQITMPVNDLAADYLFSLGDKCECLSPPEMKDRLCKTASNILSMYSRRS